MKKNVITQTVWVNVITDEEATFPKSNHTFSSTIRTSSTSLPPFGIVVIGGPEITEVIRCLISCNKKDTKDEEICRN